MKPTHKADVQGQLIAAYREEAALFRRDGKEGAALRLEQLADRAEQAQQQHKEGQ